MPISAEITFDCYYGDDQDNIEGCYRLPGSDWQVYYFTRWWDGRPEVLLNAVWRSGVTGVNVQHPKDKPLNKSVVKQVLGEALEVIEWAEVAGPNSLVFK